MATRDSQSPLDRAAEGSELVQALQDSTKRRLATLYAMDRILTRAQTLRAAIPDILEAVGGCEQWEVGTYWAVEPGEVLRCLGFWRAEGIHAPEFEALTRRSAFPPAVGLPGRVFRTREAIWIPDVAVDPNFPRAEIARKEGLHGGVGFPVWSGGRVVGVIEFFSPHVEPPDADMSAHYESIGLQLGQFVEREQAEEALKAQLHRLEILDQLKDDLIFAISHELRTPLTSILGYLEFMEEGIGGPLSDAHREFVEQIRLGTKRLENLVNDLLDFARLESGTFQLNVEPVDFVEKASEVIKSLRPQAEEAGLRLAGDFPVRPLLVTIDPQRIEQVLINLIGNAIKFTPARGHITVHAGLDDGRLRCEITDDGTGIQPSDVPKLFKRFAQLDDAQKKHGTGLGLYICKHLIEAHHGAIGVTSEPGKGSTFWFTLPARASGPDGPGPSAG